MADPRTSATVEVRTAELIGSLCLATDLGMGLPFEHGLQTTLIAMRLGAGLASVAGGVVINALAVPDDAVFHDEVGLIQRIIVLVFISPALITLGLRPRRLTA